MNDMSDLATQWGVASEYFDAFGNRRTVDGDVLAHVVDAVSSGRPPSHRMLPATVVVRHGRGERIDIAGRDSDPSLRWEIVADGAVIASGARAPITPDVPIGTYELRVTAGHHGGDLRETATLLVAPQTAYQGRDMHARMWALAVQLYGVRSERNWGHGDFTDLQHLLALAARIGAGGVALNPLHALFDDRAEKASPYSPNSRLFLNPLYIDLDAVPEFPGVEAIGATNEIRRLRQQDLIDHAGVAAIKLRGLRLAHERFHEDADADRRAQFETFRHERGPWLERFATFEHLRRRFMNVWWEWPDDFRHPDDAHLQTLRHEAGAEIEFFEFVQWLAESQLAQCCARARELKLPLGLYLDVAVGVEAGSADAWSEQEAVLNRLSVGAPPDLLNTAGQNWGLSGFSPAGLEARAFEPFRQMLREAMRYSGAVRIDHVLGLRRLFVIPHGRSAQDGTYIQLPFEALLAVIAQESVRAECIVIGEDLGTVPEGFRETMAEWGVWSYLLVLFERRHDGSFKAPEEYKWNALASFTTHDLPTFAGWITGHDQDVKRGLGIDPGETMDERRAALRHLSGALAAARGSPDLDFPNVAKFLAATNSRLVVVPMEDALGITDQPNLPGTVDEHPNWRQRLPATVEALMNDERLNRIGRIMADAGRGNR